MDVNWYVKGTKRAFKSKAQDYDYNNELSEYLKEIAEMYKYAEPSGYRGKAFEKAAVIVRKINYPLVSAKEAILYEGIGDSISKVIQDFALDSKIRLEEVTSIVGKKVDVLKLFMTVHGIGFVKATQLYEKGYRTLDDLKEAKLTNQQKLGLKYYVESHIPIQRSTIVMYDKRIRKSLKNIFHSVEIAGSYRRQAKTSGDIDVLLVADEVSIENMDAAIDSLMNDGIVMGNYLAKGPAKYMGYTQEGHHRIDVRIYTPDVYAFALFHLTGSGPFNRNMRQRALDLDMALSEYSLKYYDGEEAVLTKEESIFAALFVEYVPPEKRTESLKLEYTDYPNGLR